MKEFWVIFRLRSLKFNQDSFKYFYLGETVVEIKKCKYLQHIST